MNTSCLAVTLAALAAGDPALQPALDQLLRDAEAALAKGPFSVMDKARVPPSGDKHDYVSLGTYWWPDPAKPDGLPYIRRDGERNPETHGPACDHDRLIGLCGAVETLALAYRLTGKTHYAERAALLLRAWFLDPATRMNPNLNFGQGIPGRCEGRGIGIIDTMALIVIPEAEAQLAASPAWSAADRAGLRAWFKNYLQWLQTSPHGIEESKTSNNHATWYDAQVASFALFTGDTNLARKTIADSLARRIDNQIKPDGSQPHELSRTRAFTYSAMNLRGMFTLARLGEQAGVDVWHHPDARQPALRRALDFLAPYADAAKPWPYPEIGASNRIVLLPLLREAARVYANSAYEELLRKLPADEVARNRVQLLDPPASVQRPAPKP